MLKFVRVRQRLFGLLALAVAFAVSVPIGLSAYRLHTSITQAQPQNPPPAPKSPPQLPAPPPSHAQPAAPAPARRLQTVVLDPAHGGTDEGAHGQSGIVEKDIDLTLAFAVRARLQQDGLSVVMTRQDDRTLSFADRAAIANAQTSAIFISLHVGSTGAVGSACAYYYDFNQLTGPSPAVAGGLLPWSESQRSSQPFSRRLAQLVQAELSARLSGSPELPIPAEIFQLRTIGEPAIAVEVATVNAPAAVPILASAAPLAESISRAVRSFAAVYAAEGR